MLIFHERHQINVVLPSDDEDALTAVTLGSGWSRISSRSPRWMWETISSNAAPRSVLSFAFFVSSQSKYFAAYRVA